MDETCKFHKDCGLDYCSCGVECPEYERYSKKYVDESALDIWADEE